MSAPPRPQGSALPFLLFAIFATFWSSAAVVYDIPLAILPSAAVGTLLVVTALVRRGRSSAPPPPEDAPEEGGPG